MMNNEEIIDLLKKNFPTARPGFVKILVEALALHARKNNDYNGKQNSQMFYDAFGIKGRFYDIWRKIQRLYHLVIEEADMKVDEKLEDTAKDLGVYAFLLAEDIERLKVKQPETINDSEGVRRVHIGEEMELENE